MAATTLRLRSFLAAAAGTATGWVAASEPFEPCDRLVARSRRAARAES